MLLITGTGRSGTSVLAKYCLVMGNDPGGHWRRRADAGYEDENAATFTRAFHRGGPEAALAAAAARPFRRAVVKVPQVVTLFRPGLLDCWLEVVPDLRVLIARRPFEAVGRSYARRPRIFRMGTDAAAIAEKMRKRYEACLACLAAKGVPHRVVPMLSDAMTFRAIHEGLTAFGGLRLTFQARAARKLGLRVAKPTPEEVWGAVYDRRRDDADRGEHAAQPVGRRLAEALGRAALAAGRTAGPALAALLSGVPARGAVAGARLVAEGGQAAAESARHGT